MVNVSDLKWQHAWFTFIVWNTVYIGALKLVWVYPPWRPEVDQSIFCGSTFYIKSYVCGLTKNHFGAVSTRGKLNPHEPQSISLTIKNVFKVTRHLCFKNSNNLRPLDTVACNSSNKPSFQNPTKNLKGWFISWTGPHHFPDLTN